MEERERAGEKVGEMGPVCLPIRSRQKTCTIHPLRMNCYKLWLEVPSRLGPIWSKPVYLSPIDHGEYDEFAKRKDMVIKLFLKILQCSSICQDENKHIVQHYVLAYECFFSIQVLFELLTICQYQYLTV